MKPKHPRTAVLFALVGCFLIGGGWSTGYLELSLDAMIERSERALYGEVVSLEQEVVDGLPWTLVEVALDRDLLAPPPDDDGSSVADAESVVLPLLGGALPDGGTLAVEGMPTFVPGDRVLVLAYRERFASPIVGFAQGVWWEGELGFRDLADRLLSLDDGGELVLDGGGGNVEALLDALAQRLGARP